MGVDVNEAGNKIAAMLSQPKQPSDDTSEEVPKQEVETEVAPEPEEEYTPEPPSVEGDDTESVETFTVKVAGEEREVSLDDLRKGYMMETDYRRKTSALAESRKAIEAKEQEMSSKIEEAEAVLKFEFDNLDPDEKEYDPTAYYEKRDKLEAKQKKINDLKSEVLKDKALKQQERLVSEQQKLMDSMPEWADQKIAEQDAALIQKVWDSYGFTNDDLIGLMDHRFAMITREAALYRKLKEGRPEGKKVTPKPKVSKPGTPKTAEQKISDRSNEARNKLRKTGNMRDAAAAIKSLMR